MPFPHPCGEELERLVAAGADPHTVIQDGFIAVRGGASDMEPTEVFSVAVGPTLEAAACAVPHGKIRVASVAELRALGGSIEWAPEQARDGTMNKQHANVKLGGGNPFSDLMPNPVPRNQRVGATAP
ncbi:MAG: hypothetical protein K2X38_08895 [Gemmataceae bacterium]|nr:hypothetical protein [Gemmataceae bacterium]